MAAARIFLFSILALLFLPGWGCVSTGGGSGGQIVIGTGDTPPPPDPGPAGKGEVPGQAKGHETAARNHMRSAYRFLEMGKPEHAMKELEKARAKMGDDFWYHYYMGGAFFLLGNHPEANGSWNQAFGLTRDPQLRSRIRTCQSFAVYRTQGSSTSLGFLREAVDLDGNNSTARTIYQEMASSAQEPAPQKEAKKPGKGSGKKADEKSRGPRKKIEEDQEFRQYFLIGMPAE